VDYCFDVNFTFVHESVCHADGHYVVHIHTGVSVYDERNCSTEGLKAAKKGYRK